MFASVFVLLYVAHLLADYPLQSDRQAALKAEKSAVGLLANYTHAGTHVIVSAFALQTVDVVLGYDISTPAYVAALVWIGFSHGLIDRRRGVLAWMARAGQTEFAKHGGAAHVDQTAHITALALAALFLAGIG